MMVPALREVPVRGLWDAHRCFTSSHQDQWWLSCACALHFLAPKCFIRMSQSSSTTFFVLISFHSHSVFSSPSTSFPRSPLHEYTLNASRPSQLYFRQCYLVTGIYSTTPSNSFLLICLTICIRIVHAVACGLSWLKGALPGTLPKQLRAKKKQERSSSHLPGTASSCDLSVTLGFFFAPTLLG